MSASADETIRIWPMFRDPAASRYSSGGAGRLSTSSTNGGGRKSSVGSVEDFFFSKGMDPIIMGDKSGDLYSGMSIR